MVAKTTEALLRDPVFINRKTLVGTGTKKQTQSYQIDFVFFRIIHKKKLKRNLLIFLFKFTETFNTLIGLNANINTQDDMGQTPLHSAIQKRNFEGALLLINSLNINVNVRLFRNFF